MGEEMIVGLMNRQAILNHLSAEIEIWEERTNKINDEKIYDSENCKKKNSKTKEINRKNITVTFSESYHQQI